MCVAIFGQANAVYLFDFSVHAYAPWPDVQVEVNRGGTTTGAYDLSIPIISGHLLVPLICPTTDNYYVHVFTPADMPCHIASIAVNQVN